jgi:hypothetical protein
MAGVEAKGGGDEKKVARKKNDLSIVNSMLDYVNKLCAVPGMKVLILDQDTVGPEGLRAALLTSLC